MTNDTKSIQSAPTAEAVVSKKKSFKSTKDRITAQQSSEKKAKSPIDDIADSMLENGQYDRQESNAAQIAKLTSDNQVVALNLKKRKSLLMIEAKRAKVGDAMAEKMVEKVEITYERELRELE